MGGLVVSTANQGRLEKNWLAELISKDVIVIAPCSKFYRGCSDSTTVIIPPSIMERLNQEIDIEHLKLVWSKGGERSGLNEFYGK